MRLSELLGELSISGSSVDSGGSRKSEASLGEISRRFGLSCISTPLSQY